MGDRNANTILLVGATSLIVRQVGSALAGRGHGLLLAGRDAEELAILARDLALRHGVRVDVTVFDADRDEPAAWMDEHVDVPLTGVVLGLGVYAREEQVAREPALAQRMDHVNHRVTAGLARAAMRRVARGGFVCVISSVAGDRVRPSLASYAQSKADLNAALEALRREYADGPALVTARPGPTDTRMTWGHAGPSPPADPGAVGDDIVRAIDARRPVVYTPARWRWIMLVIRLIPGPVFRRVFAKL